MAQWQETAEGGGRGGGEERKNVAVRCSVSSSRPYRAPSSGEGPRRRRRKDAAVLNEQLQTLLGVGCAGGFAEGCAGGWLCQGVGLARGLCLGLCWREVVQGVVLEMPSITTIIVVIICP